MLRETRERIVARVKIVRKSLALERASGFAFLIINKKPQQPPCGHGGH